MGPMSKEAENLNGYLDSDGCPDVIPAGNTDPTIPDADQDNIPDGVINVQQIQKHGTNTKTRWLS